jgi:SMC interacting uncharacterized protein involved in chromosome segregation
MDNILLVIITSGFGGIVATKLFDYLTARLSARSKQESAANLTQQYVELNKITGDQLEESINQVWVVTNQNIEMQRKISQMEAKRADRDNQMEAMEAHIAALQEQINKDTEERQALRRIIEEKDKIINEVRAYMRDLLDYFEQKNISDFPVPGDDLLDTHSRIKLKNRRTRK